MILDIIESPKSKKSSISHKSIMPYLIEVSDRFYILYRLGICDEKDSGL